MSKIDELIQELCPDGVPGRQLGEFLVEQRTRAGAASNHPVFGISNSDGFLPSEEMFAKSRASLDRSNYKVVSPNDFAYNPSRINVGSIARQSHPTAVLVSPMYIAFSLSKSLDVRYFEYFLSSSAFKSQMLSGIEVGARFRFTFESFSEVVIQAPPIEVQKEIVSILDKFTQLEAQLEAELEARRTQYEVTRNRLLDFSSDLEAHPLKELIREHSPEGVPWHHLGELILENLGGGTPSRAKEDFWGGDIPWATIGDITKTELLISNTRQKISQLGLLSSSTNLIPKGWVLVAVKIAPGEMRLVESPLAINQDIRGLRLKPDLDATFLCYWSKTVSIVGNGTIVKGVSKSAIENLKVPLPPLELQKEIVSILDKLDALVNDNTIGLPAEIAARRKQYEYYRNRLLTFKELDAA